MPVEPNHSPDNQDHSSDMTSTNLLSVPRIQQTFVSRFALYLYIFLMIYGAVILASNGNPLEYYVILGLFSVNVLETLINKGNNAILRLVSSIFAIGVASILYSFAIDPVNGLIAFFYLLMVFYAFVLAPPYHYVFMTTTAIFFTLAFLTNSNNGGFGVFFAQLSLMFILGGSMELVRSVVHRSILERTRLLGKLRQARDDYAQQLEERTAELQQEVQQHKQTESKLAEGHQLLQTIVDTFPSRLFVKDRDSRFTMVNRQSLKHLHLEDEPEAVVGKSDFDFYPHFAERTYADEQHLMETGEPIIDLEEKVLDNDGVERHYLISKVPMRHPETDEIVGLVGVTTDITSVKEIQKALQQSQESLHQHQSRLKALNQITLSLAHIETLDELVYQSIHSAIQHLGFSRINCWFINPDDPEKLMGSYRVNSEGDIISSKDDALPRDLFEPIKDIVENKRINHVIRNAPIYDRQFNVIGHGDKAYTALLDGDKVIGCVYSDNLLDGQPFTDSQVELLNLYGATLGALVNRQRAQEAVRLREEEARHFQQQLKILHEVTLELESVSTVEELCKQAVLLGAQNLGFDRMGVWLTVDDQPDMRRGMWGVDPQGNLRDERSLIVPIPEIESQMVAEGDIQIFHDIKILDNDPFEPEAYLTTGWLLVGLMWDGTKRIGWLYADNAIHHQPYAQSSYELFRLYVAMLGVRINRIRTQEALRESEEEARNFQQQLKTLHEVTLQLEAVDSLDDLCQQVVVLGTQKLGFDRFGVWLMVAGEDNLCRGTWGVDADGNLRDERNIQIPIPRYQSFMEFDGDVLVLYNQDNEDPITNLDPHLGKIGWTLNGWMSDGQKRIGWISADNAIHNQPLTPNQQELFRIYVATISLLYTRRVADNLLREREIRYRAITEASTDVIVIVNRDLIITYISPSLHIIMGVKPEIVMGESISNVIHEDDVAEAERILQDCIEHPQLQTRMDEFRVRHANRHWVHMEAVMTSLVHDPIINGILISCRDLTERLIAEEGRRIVERERERGMVLRQFIGDISHDFRTPLSTIGTTAYLLQHSQPPNIDQRVANIKQQVERLTNLIDNLNTITRLDEMSDITMEQLDINTILQSIPYYQNDLVATKQLSITLDLQDNLPAITGNTGLLRDAIYHLIDNAVQYCEAQDFIVVQSYQEFENVVVEIADTGVGISEDDLPFIFDRLYRADKSRNTHTGGSGLGLAITRRIIDLHQGTIKISSQVDEGTQVYIQLPHITAIAKPSS